MTDAVAPTAASFRWKPFQIGRWLIWGGFALLLLLAPRVFTSGTALTMLSQSGYLVIVCLSYNLLLGQGGMLSFGHAVYTGLGAFFAVHAMNLASSGALPIPLPFIPLVGGLAGFGVAALLGYPSTKKSGTPFAMITLGVGELVFAMSLMFPEFFGGEGGISTNRVYEPKLFGWGFGPATQVYYLIAFYCFVCTAAMFAFTHTPLGRMLNAVRDNPERVEFIGYDTRKVRYLAFMISGFFAGIGGAFIAINFEIVTAETVSAARSGGYLLFTFLGGATFFFGPIIGAVLLVLSLGLLSDITPAWQIYLGFIFLFMVMYAPGGVASLVMMNSCGGFGKLRRLRTAYLALGGAGGVALLALSLASSSSTTSSTPGERRALLRRGAAGRPCGHLVGLAWCWSPRPACSSLARRRSVPSGARRRPRSRKRSPPGGIVSSTPATGLRGASTKFFGKTEIIRGVNSAVQPGERAAIIGPNGAGQVHAVQLDQRALRPHAARSCCTARPSRA
ncbi:MAG: branched-chain amino acid ABC transporter permease [Burkholderiaceae bacterium]